MFHTLRKFANNSQVDEIVVALRKNETADFLKQVEQEGFKKPMRVVEGGEHRQNWVADALAALDASPDDIVLVHDAVRPFVDDHTIIGVIEAVKKYGSAIAGVPAVDTVKQVDRTADGAVVLATVPRERMVMAQTPQGFRFGLLKKAFEDARADGFLGTDEAFRCVEDAARLGPVEDVYVKGADAPVPARQLLAMESERKVLGRQEGLMLGRDAEMRRLQDLFDTHLGCLVGIVGPPGLGKSRLLREFTAIAASRGADIVVARCEAHTSTLAFRALSRLLRAMFKVEGLDAGEAREHATEQCRGLLGPHSADAQILFEAMGIADATAPHLQVSADARRRRLIEILAHAVRARARRTVFALEDVHWIDEQSDDVLADFAAALDGTTSMFVTTYRPEFRGRCITDRIRR